MMSAIASQITSVTIDYSIGYSDVDQRKHQSFRASNAENVSIWLRHHVINNTYEVYKLIGA